MQARDVMTEAVFTVGPETAVAAIAALLMEKRISAVPVLDGKGAILGIVSEGDLMRRRESGTERHPSWWLSLLSEPHERALDYVKSHGGHARDVMTPDPYTVTPDTSLEKIAEILERRHIKRVPVVADGRLVGIVSRADLLRGLIARQAGPVPERDDPELKSAVEAALKEAGLRTDFLSVVVTAGQAHLWGSVNSDAERRAAGVAAENVPGVTAVRNEIGILPRNVRAALWAE
ncbi:CBS domain-containing protein [Marinibaculum pumilum]|uniref:CBS domain-containing protein n=1 Tax=Marinibaculum pumilum TaxID=1766165 RepID=A0ABV7LAT6_9PROT